MRKFRFLPLPFILGAILAAPVPARAAGEWCIDSTATPVQVLGWLAIHNLLDHEPYPKLFSEPPITGPRTGVDTTRYVALWRSIAEQVVSDIPDSIKARYATPFAAWPDSAKTAFVARTWRQSLFPPIAPPPPDSLPPPPPATGLLTESDFQLAGYFRLPSSSIPNTSAYGGGAASWVTSRGTILVSGYSWLDTAHYGGRVLEVAAPALSLSRTLSQVPIAAAVRDWRDVTGGQYATFTDGEQHRVGGLYELQDGRDVEAGFDGYGADGRDLRSIFIEGDTGGYHVGPKSTDGTNSPTSYWRSTGGFALIPRWFSDAHCPGLDVAVTGGRRLGGGTYGSPMGPSVIGTTFLNRSGVGGDLPWKTLMDFPTPHAVVDYSVCSGPIGDRCSSDRFLGIAWIDSTVAVLADKCSGTSHYYDPSGIEGPARPGFCPGTNKGQVCDGPVHAELWLFAARDLARVADGGLQPWEVTPYLVIRIDDWLPVSRCDPGVAGLSFDAANRRLVLFQQGVDATRSQYDLSAVGVEIQVGR